MPQDAFILKIQRALCHPKWAWTMLRLKKQAPENVTPVMKDLHWLNIGAYINNFKTLHLMFKILNDLASCYLSSLLLTQISTGSFTPLI